MNRWLLRLPWLAALRRAEHAVDRLVDGHILPNPLRISMRGVDFPAKVLLHQWQAIGCIAIDFVS